MIRHSETLWYTLPREDTDRPILALLIGAKRSLMVDGGNSPRHASEFLDAARSRGLPAPDFVAITHAHGDHIFGLGVLPALVIANRATAQCMHAWAERGWEDDAVAERVRAGTEHPMTAHMLKVELPGPRPDFRIRQPDLVYDGGMDIDLGGITCRLRHIGGHHTADSAILTVPEWRIVFLGDCLYLRDDTPENRGALHAMLREVPADLYFDSHRDQPLTTDDLARWRDGALP